jgi:hypothetical protein
MNATGTDTSSTTSAGSSARSRGVHVLTIDTHGQEHHP